MLSQVLLHSKTRHDTKEKTVMLSRPISSHHKLFWVNSVKSHQSLLPPIVNKSGDTVSDDSARADLFNQNFFLILQRKTAPIWMTCKTHYKYYTICY